MARRVATLLCWMVVGALSLPHSVSSDIPALTLFSFSSGGAVAMLDVDSDGLSDDWEIQNGLDPDFAGDAVLDLDGDGLSALQEYLQGYDPWQLDSDGNGVADGASSSEPMVGIEMDDVEQLTGLAVHLPAV